MFKNITSAAKSFKERVDLGKALDATKQLALSKFEAGKATAALLVEEHWSTVERVLVEGLLSIAEEKLKDDKTLETLFEKAYEVLPVAARLILSRDRFLEFSMARRDPLLLKVQDYRAQRSMGESLALPNHVSEPLDSAS